MKKLTCYVMLLFIIFQISAQSDYENFQNQQNQNFNQYRTGQIKEMANYYNRQDSLFIQYKDQIEKLWNEFKESTPREWVSYNSDFTGRSQVDFEIGGIKVEAVVEANASPEGQSKQEEKAKEIVKQQVISILKEKDEITKEPILKDQVEIPGKDEVIHEKNIEKVAEEIIELSQKEEIISKEGKKLVKFRIDLKLVPDNISIRLEKYKPNIEKFCKKYDIDIKFALAVIHTESFFNPKAYNRHGNAYGMMQIVPKYAGLTMNYQLYKKKKKPSSGQLYDPKINLEMGIGYMRWLADNKWSKVTNKPNQYYCIVCSYNGGPGSIYKAMTGKMNKIGQKKWDKMISDLNSMDNEKLYIKLRRDIPWQETRNYIKHIKERIDKYYRDI